MISAIDRSLMEAFRVNRPDVVTVSVKRVSVWSKSLGTFQLDTEVWVTLSNGVVYIERDNSDVALLKKALPARDEPKEK